MKKLFLTLLSAAVLFLMVGMRSAQAFDLFDQHYYSNTATAWTKASTNPVIIAGTVPYLDYNPVCSSIVIFENTLALDCWIQFIMTKNGTADINGAWFPIPAHTGFFSDQTPPAGGIAVRVTGTATISYFSKK